jgi:hypothetical protein
MGLESTTLIIRDDEGKDERALAARNCATSSNC